MSIFAGVAVLASLALVAPAADASHDDPAGTNHPGTGAAGHENPPVWPFLDGQPTPHSVCVVTGTVDIDDPYDENPVGPQHATVIPEVNENPSHSHFTFGETLIVCAGEKTESYTVTANGGNDGHYIDLLDSGCVGIPKVTGNPKGASKGDTGDCGNDPTAPELDAKHPFNGHHGSVNESAWSNSSDYTPCTNNPVSTQTGPNLGNITVEANLGLLDPDKPAGTTAEGWVKYIRVGPAVNAWGHFECADAASWRGMKFLAELVFLPNPAVDDNFFLNGVAYLYD